MSETTSVYLRLRGQSALNTTRVVRLRPHFPSWYTRYAQTHLWAVPVAQIRPLRTPRWGEGDPLNVQDIKYFLVSSFRLNSILLREGNVLDSCFEICGGELPTGYLCL